LSTDYTLEGTNITDDANMTITDPAALFVSPPFDVHLLPNAAAIDAGNATMAPAIDADRIPRPQGNGIDVGAYEWHTPDVGPIGGSGGSGGTGGQGGGNASGGMGGMGGSDSGGNDNTPGDAGSCGCRVAGSPEEQGLSAIFGLGLAVMSIRRRRGQYS
ncbi:MAG TPA: choice-of-anchor Q domain-containing protein, partial [Polyangium sp.]|nr:choice-of-anchor Q domain-containing protein [Polyangium sp.]